MHRIETGPRFPTLNGRSATVPLGPALRGQASAPDADAKRWPPSLSIAVIIALDLVLWLFIVILALRLFGR